MRRLAGDENPADVVVGLALLPDLRRHAVETLRAVLGACERRVGDGMRDSSVAVLEVRDREQGFQRIVSNFSAAQPASADNSPG